MYTTKKTLIKRLQGGDDISWNEFYLFYSPFVSAIGQKLGMTPEDCKDLMQEIMVTLFNGKEILRYDPSRGRFRTYFGTIVRHKALKMIQKEARASISGLGLGADTISENRQNSLFFSDYQGENDPFQKIFDEEYRKCLLELALNELRKHVEPETYDIFEMVVLQSRPPKDVAKYLGISRAVIDVYCSRCRKKLQKIVSEIRKDTPDFNPELPQ
jgi:RNA polymerase sigma-70 factor (ECF subfamily)